MTHLINNSLKFYTPDRQLQISIKCVSDPGN